MATLQPGEKARMYALGGIMRGGASRGGYVSGLVFIDIGGDQVGNGADPGVGVLLDSLTISDELDETPNTCTFTIKGLVPTPGQEIRITLGSQNGGTPLFAGHILQATQRYLMVPRHVVTDVSAVDYTWLFAFTGITTRYINESATAIAQDLTAQAAVNGFSAGGVVPNLPVINEMTITDEDLANAMTRVARRIGAYWYVDYAKAVHLFFEETGSGAPLPLTPSHPSLANFDAETDSSQALTRVYVEGRGTRVISPVLLGETLIPVDAVDMFTPAADVFAKVSFQGSDGGAQHLDFTGIALGGAGSLVGPGVGPPGAPTAIGVAGTGLSVGAYLYAYTDVTASGETRPSPVASVTLGTHVAPPVEAPTVRAPQVEGSLTPGAHSYAYTWVTGGGGETTPSPASAATAAIPLASSGGISGGGSYMGVGGVLPPNTWYWYRASWVGADGSETPTTWPAKALITGAAGNTLPTLTVTEIPAGVTAIKYYRSLGAPAQFTYQNGPFYYAGTAPTSPPLWPDTTPQASLGPVIPTTATGYYWPGTYTVDMPAATDPTVTSRRLYRTAAGDGALKFLRTISGAAYIAIDDADADSVLGAAAPATNTAGDEVRAVAVSNVAPGPSPTSSRKIYRTYANGGQLRLLATLADNTTTVFTDTTPDASLGANAPTTDTSALASVPGQVAAGDPTLIVANAGAFRAAGGWAVIGNGEQVIRYTGVTATALIGIPPAGVGAITAAVGFNSTVTAASMLTGIPTTGLRSLSVRPLTSGDELYLVVQVDDTAAQAQLASTMGIASGIRSEWVQDRRLSIAEARSRGLATLQARPLGARRVSYTCRDLRTSSGKTISVDLPAPTSVSGAFKIQQVTISGFRPYANQYPTFAVQASSSRFSFEDLLRLVKTKE